MALGDEAFAVEAHNVSRIFGSGETRVAALDDVSVAIRQNEFFTLLGPSGCGKTTLLRLIAGFDMPTSGTILLEGSDISLLPPYQRPVNTVFQSYALFPHMTVAGNIAFGLEMLGKPKAEISETVDRMLQLVQMQELKARQVSEISGGQQQRVALARALAPHPRVLLLDEPLSALDYKLRKEMQIELKRLQNETGITFVFVTHDQEEALTMSDRIAVMEKGKILQIGPPREIYDHPAERFVADFIGDTNFLSVEVTAVSASGARIKLSSGKTVAAALSDDAFSKGPATVVIRPEHARLTKAKSKSALIGTLTNIVYIGTDTQYHMKLADGTAFVVRMQNRRDSQEAYAEGDELGIEIAGDAVQVLRD
jgi:spermidine/putrescine transport system ATP-binding protein